MPKCNICNSKIAETFLEKLKGTVIYKPGSSKQYFICFACQKKLTKGEILGKL